MTSPVADALKTVPAAWPRRPLKHAAWINRHSLPDDTDSQFSFRYVDIGSVNSDGEVGELPELRFEEAPSRARRIVQSGDVLVSTVRTYLRAIARIEDAAGLVCSTGFATLSAKAGIDSRFLHWWCCASPFVEEVVARSAGIVYPAINPSDLGLIPIPVPPPPTQRAIADFLDRETARIDGLMQAKQRLTDLLVERFRIQLGTRVADESMARVRLGRCINRIDQGTSPICESFPAEKGEWGVLKLSAVHRGVFRPWENKALPVGEPAQERYCLKPGDVLITRSNTPDLVGDACVVREDPGRLLLPDLIYRFKVEPESFDGRFLTYLLISNSMRSIISATARGSSQSMVKLRAEDIRAWEVPRPELKRQRAIADELDALWRTTQLTTDRLAAQIHLLQEHRQASITATVMGVIIEATNTAVTRGSESS